MDDGNGEGKRERPYENVIQYKEREGGKTSKAKDKMEILMLLFDWHVPSVGSRSVEKIPHYKPAVISSHYPVKSKL